MYDNSICPTRAESAQILNAMSQINAASAVAPLAAKQLASAANGTNGANGGTVIRHSGHITIALGSDE